MPKNLNRRGFLKKTIAASAGATLGLSLEGKSQPAKTTERANLKMPAGDIKGLPAGKIGNLKVSRLICGGNMIGGYAHSRDLIYVSELFKSYNTDEKVMDTLELCEERGINTVLTDPREKPLRILNRYWKERGGKIQWIAEGHPKVNDIKTNLKMSIDNGASAIYVQGGVGDKWVKNDHVDLIGEAVNFIKENGLVAGVGGHSLDVPVAVEKAGIEVDFYMKTLHLSKYFSFTPEANHDNAWSTTPEKTIAFMKKVDKPWLAFKVLAAGAIHPRVGFRYAFNSGADFIVAGMFDFQVIEDVLTAKSILSTLSKTARKRPWRA